MRPRYGKAAQSSQEMCETFSLDVRPSVPKTLSCIIHVPILPVTLSEGL